MGTLCAGPLVAVLLCLLLVFAVGEEISDVPNPVVVDATSAAPVSGPAPSLDVISLLSVQSNTNASQSPSTSLDHLNVGSSTTPDLRLPANAPMASMEDAPGRPVPEQSAQDNNTQPGKRRSRKIPRGLAPHADDTFPNGTHATAGKVLAQASSTPLTCGLNAYLIEDNYGTFSCACWPPNGPQSGSGYHCCRQLSVVANGACACRPGFTWDGHQCQGRTVCDKCNVPMEQGGCQCDSNCNCVRDLNCRPGEGLMAYANWRFCMGCRAGTFSPGGVMANCIPCPRGRVAPPGATQCTACAAPLRPDTMAGNCVSALDCRPGTYFNRAQWTCLACPANTFSMGGTAEQCRTCAVGTVPNDMATDCIRRDISQLSWQFSYMVSSDLHMGGTGHTCISIPDMPQRIVDVVVAARTLAAEDTGATGYVINGDITEFYQVDKGIDQPNRIFDILNRPGWLPNQYRGLGNHDFGNNIDDCTWRCFNGVGPQIESGVGACDRFACAARALRDFQWGNHKWRSPTGGVPSTILNTDSGSGSYHWAEGGWSFFMLHRNPYVVFPKRCYPTGLVWCEYGYEVQSPMENGWLQARLRWATTQGHKIVLFFHQLNCGAGDKYCQVQDLSTATAFRQLIDETSVVGIFVGHTHSPEWLGSTLRGTNVPIINSGASWYKMLLQSHFASDVYTVGIREFQAPERPQWKLVPGAIGPCGEVVNTIRETYWLQQRNGVWKVVATHQY